MQMNVAAKLHKQEMNHVSTLLLLNRDREIAQ